MINPGILRVDDVVYMLTPGAGDSSHRSVVVLKCKLLAKCALASLSFNVTIPSFEERDIERSMFRIREQVLRHIKESQDREEWSYKVLDATPLITGVIGIEGNLDISNRDVYLSEEDALEEAKHLTERTVRRLKRNLRNLR